MKIGRLIGGLFLIIFTTGIIVFQVLQGPVLFADDFLTSIADHSFQIILSTLLSISSGVISIIISVLLLPLINEKSRHLGYLYLAFCVINFIATAIDNGSVLSLLELSKAYVNADPKNSETFQTLGTLFYGKHWWTHYMFLLTSCLPVFVFFYAMFFTKLLPRIISVAGMIAVLFMFTQIVASIFGHGISMNMMLPIGLVQVFLPIWLMVKGFKYS